MLKLTERRLNHIIQHLESGKLGHEHFDFEVVNDFDPKSRLHPGLRDSEYFKSLFETRWRELKKRNPRLPAGCGTHGCVLGEFPFIFPRRFGFTHDGKLWDKKTRTTESPVLISSFLGIELIDDYYGLFYPCSERWWAPGRLTPNATLSAVIKSFRMYIDAVKRRDTGAAKAASEERRGW